MKPAELACLALIAAQGLMALTPSVHAAPQRSNQASVTTQGDVASLLELQRSGRFASPHQQTLPGDAQTRAWERYLKSFSHPIPARYIDDKFKSQ